MAKSRNDRAVDRYAPIAHVAPAGTIRVVRAARCRVKLVCCPPARSGADFGVRTFDFGGFCPLRGTLRRSGTRAMVESASLSRLGFEGRLGGTGQQHCSHVICGGRCSTAELVGTGLRAAAIRFARGDVPSAPPSRCARATIRTPNGANLKNSGETMS